MQASRAHAHQAKGGNFPLAQGNQLGVRQGECNTGIAVTFIHFVQKQRVYMQAGFILIRTCAGLDFLNIFRVR